MRVIAVKMLSDFYRQDAYRDCAGPAKAWYALATVAQWARPADVVAQVPKVGILKDGRLSHQGSDTLWHDRLTSIETKRQSAIVVCTG